MKREKTILFVGFGGWDSTLTLRARSLARELSLLGWNACMALPDSLSAVVRKSTEGFSVERIGSGVDYLYSLRKLRDEFRPSFVHFLNPGVKAIAAKSIFRKSLFIGDWEDWHTNPFGPSIRRLDALLADRLALKFFDIIISCSHWLKDQFEKRGRSDVLYLPYAGLPDQFQAGLNPFAEPTAVFMGSLHKHWDHDIVVDAAELLRGQGDSSKVQMIGGGEDLESIQSRVSRCGLSNLSVTGFLSWADMLNRLSWAHVLLFPIRPKPLNLARCPFKVFQYAQAQRPIITCNVGEVPVFLGTKAIYVEPSAGAFARAISTSLSEERVNAVDYGINKHTWRQRAIDFNQHMESSWL